jgi:hypothetical protein
MIALRLILARIKCKATGHLWRQSSRITYCGNCGRVSR